MKINQDMLDDIQSLYLSLAVINPNSELVRKIGAKYKDVDGFEQLDLGSCKKCGVKAVRTCTDTPAGGWGTMKCGKSLCDSCECGCKDVEIC